MNKTDVAKLATAAVDRFTEMGNITMPGDKRQKARQLFNQAMIELTEAIYPKEDKAA